MPRLEKKPLEGITESVCIEIQPFGTKVILVEHGTNKSNFLKNVKVAQKAAGSSSPSHKRRC